MCSLPGRIRPKAFTFPANVFTLRADVSTVTRRGAGRTWVPEAGWGERRDSSADFGVTAGACRVAVGGSTRFLRHVQDRRSGNSSPAALTGSPRTLPRITTTGRGRSGTDRYLRGLTPNGGGADAGNEGDVIRACVASRAGNAGGVKNAAARRIGATRCRRRCVRIIAGRIRHPLDCRVIRTDHQRRPRGYVHRV